MQESENPDRGRALRVGAVTGVNPGRWVRTWQERYPRRPLTLTVVEQADQRRLLSEGSLTFCFVRDFEPGTEFHLIPLFEERQVVVLARQNFLAEFDEIDVADLRDEPLLQSLEEVPGLPGGLESGIEESLLGAPLADRVRLVGQGQGALILPMSVARLHSRRDVVSRPVAGLPTVPVGLAWLRSLPQEVTEDFIGVVRGRSANSSRGRSSGGPRRSRALPTSGADRASGRRNRPG